jgi:hypothetical protein
VVKFSHDWLPIGVGELRCSGTTDICPQCSEIETVPHLYRCQARSQWRHRFLIHLTEHLKETNTAADLCCIIIKGIESWFITDDTNDPDSSETIAQISWFQVLKGYIPVDWTSRQAGFYRRQSRKSKKDYTGKQWTKELIEFSGRTATAFRKIGAWRHLAKTAPTTPALAHDKRHSNEWQWHMRTLRSC